MELAELDEFYRHMTNVRERSGVPTALSKNPELITEIDLKGLLLTIKPWKVL